MNFFLTLILTKASIVTENHTKRVFTLGRMEKYTMVNGVME